MENGENENQWSKFYSGIFENCIVRILERHFNTKLSQEDKKIFKRKIYDNNFEKICSNWQGKYDGEFTNYAVEEFKKIISKNIKRNNDGRFYWEETGEVIEIPTHFVYK
ncbi:MAG: hypothetical protein QW469_00670 [Candidatus Aenigmatarchaeota archaeon]